MFIRNVEVTPIRGSRFPKPTEEMRHWYHKDHLGTPRLVTDDAGNVVSEHKYEPFGVELPSDSSAGMWPNNLNTRRFTGHERDFETGLDYMMARFFMSRDARFTSVDPSPGNLQNPQSQNRYNYTLNNPLKFVDPSGKRTTLARGEGEMWVSNTKVSDPFGMKFGGGLEGKGRSSDEATASMISGAVESGGGVDEATWRRQEEEKTRLRGELDKARSNLRAAEAALKNAEKTGEVPDADILRTIVQTARIEFARTKINLAAGREIITDVEYTNNTVGAYGFSSDETTGTVYAQINHPLFTQWTSNQINWIMAHEAYHIIGHKHGKDDVGEFNDAVIKYAEHHVWFKDLGDRLASDKELKRGYWP